MPIPAHPRPQLLKQDAFGRIDVDAAGDTVLRDTTSAPAWAGWLARRLAHREAAALARLDGIDGVPRLRHFDGRVLARSYIPGLPMPAARPTDAAYYRDALRLLRRLHSAGVAHNDLAKEANWLRRPDGRAAVVDFQLAFVTRVRGRTFRLMAREDLRHLLKHKRHYAAHRLTAYQRRILATPTWPSRIWRAAVKPVYSAVTRGLLRWPERSGPEERQRIGRR